MAEGEAPRRRRIPLLAFLPPVIFAALAGLFLGGMFRKDPDVLPSMLVGKAAPPVAVTPLGDLKGFDRTALTAPGVKLVNFWASWCAPCRVEHAQLMAMKKAGVTIYGVNYKDDPRKARAFLDSLGDPFREIGADAAGQMALDWGVYGVPETFVIDGDGTVLLRFPGPITPDILKDRIQPVIASAKK